MDPAITAKYKPYWERTPWHFDMPGRRWPANRITRAPVWCSVDLRDGNQALAIPMNVDEKLEMFDLLVACGFKEIEVGFPAASNTEFTFCRRLIEEKRIPEDVYIQVLVQAREHLIRKTFEAIHGAPNAVVHLYNSTSPLQRRLTFGNASREKIKAIAVDAARLIHHLEQDVPGTRIRLQYSPESFSDTELDFAMQVCQEVIEVWESDGPREPRSILNLPATVEWTPPNVHADQIEWCCRYLEEHGWRERVLISLHTHNDRGTGVAATELGLLAGADRVEGTLFGNGERTGNLDIVTVALNLFSQGIDPGLDFHDLPRIRSVYERLTRMSVPERWPYAGDLVFTAFSGSHQDAIKKGMDARAAAQRERPPGAPPAPWEVPYLAIDPEDIGRTYEAIIRINSQSGKGGVAYILQREFGLDLPKLMHPDVGQLVGAEADQSSRELPAHEIRAIFEREFVNREVPLRLIDYDVHVLHGEKRQVRCVAEVEYNGQRHEIAGLGNGPINAFVHALEEQGWKHFSLLDYRSHAIGAGSATDSAAYICIRHETGQTPFWGCGIDPSIETAGLKALVTAFNRSL